MNAADFLNQLWAPGWHSLCAEPHGGGPFTTHGTYDTPEALIDAARKLRATHNLWWGIHGVGQKAPPGKRGLADDVTAVRVIVADLDWADPTAHSSSELLAESIVRDLVTSTRPTVVVNTGHGLHAYWALDRVVSASEGERLTVGVHRHLQSLGLKTECGSLAAVLRLPNTTNHKRGRDGDAAPVPVVVEHSDGPTWTPEQLAAEFPLEDEQPATTTTPTARDPFSTDGPMDRACEALSRRSWGDVLGRYGWTHVGSKGAVDYWRHPTATSSLSATTNHNGTDRLVIFSESADLPSDLRAGTTTNRLRPSFDRLDVIAAYTLGRIDRDARVTAARAEVPEEWESRTRPDRHIGPAAVATVLEADDDQGDVEPYPLVALDDLFAPSPITEAHVDGLIFPGRWTQIVAAAKAGKSTLGIHLAVSLALGRDPFSGAPRPALSVTYLDAEMGRLDMGERLRELNLNPDDLRGRFRYTDVKYHLNELQGATAMLSSLQRHRADVVIIDGLNGAVIGAENDDTTWRPFYDHFVHHAKVAGIGIVTLDNLGHDQTKSTRGHTAKIDKPDAVLKLTRTDDGVKLKTTHQRTAAYLDELTLKVRGTDGTRPITYEHTDDAWPAGTAEVMRLLDQLGVDQAAGRTAARAALKQAGHSAANTALAAAIRARKRGVRTLSGLSADSPTAQASDTPHGQGDINVF